MLHFHKYKVVKTEFDELAIFSGVDLKFHGGTRIYKVCQKCQKTRRETVEGDWKVEDFNPQPITNL